MNELGHVKVTCHDPRNERCAHNLDPRFDCQCRGQRLGVRKPFKVVRVHDENVARRTRPDLVWEIYQNTGAITLREKGKRRRYTATTADIFQWLLRREAMRYLGMKAANKAARKKARKARSRR